MATPLFLRITPLFRLRLQRHTRLAVSFFTPSRRPSSTVPEPVQPDEAASYLERQSAVLSDADKLKYPRWDDPDFRKWKDKEDVILQDIEPIIFLTKEILHSERYMDGERLTDEDEKAVLEKLLPYHPHSEDKIGCGLDFIMVDRHPQFRHSRCLFVVRVDGGWIDFSYQKCLRTYIRLKYPSYAERFIQEHFKRSS